MKVIVTSDVSPTFSAVAVTTIVAVGRRVSMVVVFDVVVPSPVLPAASVTPLLVSVMRLLMSLVLAVGVKVAVQVMPPFTEATAVSAPLAIVRSALVKPVTASLKVIVTSDVSPAFSAVAVTTIVAVGRCVLMV